MNAAPQAPPDRVRAPLVTGDDELRDLSGRLLHEPVVGLDTEFVRTRTFFPRLGLIQVSWADQVVLLDAVALEDWSPWIEVLVAPDVVKVLHSPSEDLEVFHHLAGTLPDPLFDTQIAATLAGYGGTMGYQKLVATLVGVDLPKGEQRSNWLRRPLTASQQLYAALDVVYLLEIAEHLGRRLVELDRWSWLVEEMSAARQAAVDRQRPEQQFERLARSSMNQQELRALFGLNEWREEQARKRDLPRRFVLGDDVLIELAKKRPQTEARLKNVASLKTPENKRYGSELIAAIAVGLELERELEAPANLSGKRNSEHKMLFERLRQALEEQSLELELPSDFLLTRKTMDRCVDLFRREKDWSEELQGWRREVLAEPLRRALERV